MSIFIPGKFYTLRSKCLAYYNSARIKHIVMKIIEMTAGHWTVIDQVCEIVSLICPFFFDRPCSL